MDAWPLLITNEKLNVPSPLVTWLTIKYLPKLDFTQCHLSCIAINDPCSQTACLWVSASLCSLSVCLQSVRKTAIASTVVASHVAYRLALQLVLSGIFDTVLLLTRDSRSVGTSLIRIGYIATVTRNTAVFCMIITPCDTKQKQWRTHTALAL